MFNMILNKSNDADIIFPGLKNVSEWKITKNEASLYGNYNRLRKPKIYPNVLYAIGDTPMIKLNKIPEIFGLKCEIVVKCEYFNPGGSVKDRSALKMIEEAEKNGKLKPGDMLIEPTTGNTGIGLALAASVKNYRCTIVMPEKMSNEKVNILKAFGADIIRTPSNVPSNAPESHISVARALNQQLPESILFDQYRNPGNPIAHYDSTAEEILYQCDDNIDMIVMCAGTGGTITGVGRKIKDRCPNCQVIGVDPTGSVLGESVLSNDVVKTSSEVEGIGCDFIPTVLDQTVIDRWIRCNDKESFEIARMLIKKEGLLCGGSSGSAVSAALKAAKGLKEGQRCVVILPDGVRNYMTKFVDEQWLIEKDFIDIHADMKAKYWWWDLKVGSLKVPSPLTILPHLSCVSTIKILKKEGLDQLPVVDHNGLFRGVVTLHSLMNEIMNEGIYSKSVGEVLTTVFPEVERDTTLGRLSIIFKKYSFAAIIDCQKVATHEKKISKKIILGIVTKIDLINFLLNEENCLKTALD